MEGSVMLGTIKQEITMPKNQFRLFTVDKDGKETGKEYKGKNLWVANGYLNWLMGDTAFRGEFSTTRTTGNYWGGPTCFISSSDDPITIDTLALANVQRVSTSTQLTTRAGVGYPRADFITVSGNEYLKLTHLFAFTYGALNQNVRQIGVNFSQNNNTIYCGTTLPADFPITNEEQLLVTYSYYFPRSVVAISNSENVKLFNQVLPITIMQDETPVSATATFKKPYVILNDQSTYYNLYIMFSPVSYVSGYGDGRTFYNGASTMYWHTVYDMVERSNNNRTYKVRATISTPPTNPANIDISKIELGYIGGNTFNHTEIDFSVPISKTEDDRVQIQFFMEVTINEVDF